MPAYSDFVSSMTAPTKEHREAGLGCLLTMFERLPKEQQLSVALEPGLLAAVEPFLRGGDKAGTAIDLLLELAKLDKNMSTATTRKCEAAIFDSLCFSSIKGMASTGGTTELKRKAWRVIGNVACVEEERKKALLDSADMAALLQAGLESKDDFISETATATVANLCCNDEVASDLRDGHMDLRKALVVTFSTSGVSFKFYC